MLDQSTGTREIQADGYANATSVPDQYDVTIYNSADHGFDAANCESSTPGADPDLDACRQALPVAIGLLTPLTAP